MHDVFKEIILLIAWKMFVDRPFGFFFEDICVWMLLEEVYVNGVKKRGRVCGIVLDEG